MHILNISNITVPNISGLDSTINYVYRQHTHAHKHADYNFYYYKYTYSISLNEIIN